MAYANATYSHLEFSPYSEKLTALTAFTANPASADTHLRLADLHQGDRGLVAGLMDDGAVLDDETGATVGMRLIEIGFVPGERFEIVAESWPGGDPIAVRIGGSCFALRRREAQVILVVAEQS